MLATVFFNGSAEHAQKRFGFGGIHRGAALPVLFTAFTSGGITRRTQILAAALPARTRAVLAAAGADPDPVSPCCDPTGLDPGVNTSCSQPTFGAGSPMQILVVGCLVEGLHHLQHHLQRCSCCLPQISAFLTADESQPFGLTWQKMPRNPTESIFGAGDGRLGCEGGVPGCQRPASVDPSRTKSFDPLVGSGYPLSWIKYQKLSF